MSKIRKFLGLFFGESRSMLDLFEHQPLHALAKIERMEPETAVRILVDGIRYHPSSKVKEHCIRALLPYDLSDGDLNVVIGILKHPSAQLRHVAVSFFGLRGSQGRPVLDVLDHLIEMLQHLNPSMQGDSFEETVAKTALPMTIAAAIKTTVGAERLMIDTERRPFGLSDFRATLVEIGASSADPIMREDARKYLECLFPWPQL